MPLLDQAQYARHRGCSEAAVNGARKNRIAAAVVIRDGKVLIDRDRADDLWRKNSRRRRGDDQPVEVVKDAPAKVPEEKLPSDKELKEFILGLPEDEIPDDLNTIIKRKEHYNAEKARVLALKERGEVLPADQVRNEAFALAQAVRDAFLTLPDRLAPQLAATMDARVCHQLLTAEIGVALRGLADG